MKAAIQNGLLNINSTVLDFQPACSSGNCTWPSYRTLAICARSANVTSHLQVKRVSAPGNLPGSPKENQPRWSLSQQNYIQDNGLTLSSLGSVAKADPIESNNGDDQGLGGDSGQPSGNPIALNFTDSIAFQDSALPVADVFMIFSNARTEDGGHPGTFFAVEFVLEWCVQNFTTTVISGVPSTQRHDVFRNFSRPDPSQAFAIYEGKPNDGDNRDYQIDFTTHYYLQKYFQGLLRGIVNMTMNDPAAQLSASSDAALALFTPFHIFGMTMDGQGSVPWRGGGQPEFDQIINNIATGMTNV